MGFKEALEEYLAENIKQDAPNTVYGRYPNPKPKFGLPLHSTPQMNEPTPNPFLEPMPMPSFEEQASEILGFPVTKREPEPEPWFPKPPAWGETPEWMEDSWERTRQLPDPEPIPGGHAISAAQKGFRYLFPEADRVIRRGIGGEYDSLQDAVADFYDRPGQDGLAMGLENFIPGAGITRFMSRVRHRPDADTQSINSFIDAFSPENEWAGGLRYVRPQEGAAPVFTDVWVDPAYRKSPGVAASMFDQLKKELGPELDNLELGTEIIPSATDFWKAVHKRRVNDYPNLKERLGQHIQKAEARKKAHLGQSPGAGTFGRPPTRSAPVRRQQTEKPGIMERMFPSLGRARGY